jgi:hypothetical protein
MTKVYAEIESILRQLLPQETNSYDFPADADWQSLESMFNCQFGDDFKAFISLMSKYHFPGDILNVSTGRTNGNDTISFSYEFEMKLGEWDCKMIPFYSIGNGDYFCLKSDECPSSRVYYYYAEIRKFAEYSDSFEKWIHDLPAFLT